MQKIYIVEDDPKIATLLKQYIEKYNYEVHISKRFDNILNDFIKIQPSLVLLDINLPKYDGFYWCRQIRTTSNVPIMFISARNGEMDQIMAIENGGDDYITKPFSAEVVVAKIKGILRRTYGEYSQHTNSHVIDLNGLLLYYDQLYLEWKGQRVELSKKEFALLELLIKNPEKVVSREKILEVLWDDISFVDDNTLSVNITRVRRKLQELGIDNSIETIRGKGYRLIPFWRSLS